MAAVIKIHDLERKEEIDRNAMNAFYGGGHPAWGNYDHTHSGSWRVQSYSSYYKYVRRGGRSYRYLQRKWTLARRQVRHIGRLYIRRS